MYAMKQLVSKLVKFAKFRSFLKLNGFKIKLEISKLDYCVLYVIGNSKVVALVLKPF